MTSRRHFLRSLLAAPAIVSIDRIMPVRAAKLVRATQSDLEELISREIGKAWSDAFNAHVMGEPSVFVDGRYLSVVPGSFKMTIPRLG